MTRRARQVGKAGNTPGNTPGIKTSKPKLVRTVKEVAQVRAGFGRTVAANDTSPVHTSSDRIPQPLVDPSDPSAVDVRPDGAAAVTAAASVVPPTMETEHFGTVLRRARESREIVLADVALKTKVSRSTLEMLERGQLGDLPSGVYVRGFIRSFARAVGTDETESLLLYERALEARSKAEKARAFTPVTELPPPPLGMSAEEEALAPRRGLGLAVFVIILLLIATITLSLLLRRPPPTGEGLSLAPASPASTEPGRTWSS